MGLATLAASRTQPMDLVEDQFPERVTGRLVTSDYFQVLGFSPALGRGFLPEDEKAGAAPVVALSHRLWTERFQKDPRILGRPIELDGKAYAVVGVSAVGLSEAVAAPSRPALLVLLGAVVALLLSSCANVAHLLLARAARRRTEMSVRSALGADRRRLMRQLFTESALLSLLGGTLGVGLAWLMLDTLVLIIPTRLPPAADVSINGPVLLSSLTVSLCAAFVFGAFPALQVRSADRGGVLRGGTSGSQITSHQRTNQVLAVIEMAAALILLIGGGLLLKSFIARTSVDPGFEAERIVAARVSLPRAR